MPRRSFFLEKTTASSFIFRELQGFNIVGLVESGAGYAKGASVRFFVGQEWSLQLVLKTANTSSNLTELPVDLRSTVAATDFIIIYVYIYILIGTSLENNNKTEETIN